MFTNAKTRMLILVLLLGGTASTAAPQMELVVRLQVKAAVSIRLDQATLEALRAVPKPRDRDAVEPGYGSDGTRTRDLRRDRPAL